MDLNTLIIVSGAVMTILIIFVMLMGNSHDQKKRQERLKSLSQRRFGINAKAHKKGDADTVRKKDQDSNRVLAFLNSIAPKRQEMEKLLQRTGKSISIGQFVGAMVGAAVCVFVVIFFIVKLKLFVSIMFAVGAGILLPLVVVKNIAERRLQLFLRDFPDAIDLMVRGLRSGLPVSESMTSVSNEFDGPIGDEFRTVMETVQFGAEMEKALWQMAERLPSADVKFFVITLSIQKDTGGNLAETLMNLSSILRSRKQMVLKVKALSSEAKASAMILGSLPFVLFAILTVISPDYIFMLFEDPRGHKMLGVGGGLILIGIVVMRKLVNFRI